MDAMSLLLGVVGSVVATIIVMFFQGPVSRIICGHQITKVCSNLRRRLSEKFSLLSGFRHPFFDADCEQVWRLTGGSKNYRAENKSQLKLYKFGQFIAGESQMTTKTGVPCTFRISAVISGGYITGRWEDPRDGGYYGVFQLIRSSTHDKAEGVWAGFSQDNVLINSGEWIWTVIV